MPSSPELTGYAPNTLPSAGQRPASGRYAGMSAADIITEMYRNGFTQEGVNAVYAMRGLGPAPTLPAGLEESGAHPGAGRAAGAWIGSNGKPIGAANASPDWYNFRSSFASTAIDPFRHYDVGNWLGLAGMVVGGAMAGSAAAGGAAGGGAGGAGGAGGGSTGGGLGIFSNGGAGGLAGVGGGNAGALAASGGISGGAGIGGTSGALGGLLGGSSAGGNMGWGDWVNLAGQLYGSYAQGQGASRASNAQNAALQAGIDEQRRQFDVTRADQMPWLASGVSALGRLNDPTAFQTSPGYNFVRGEGNRDIQNQFAARGGAQSGNALRALTQYNQNLASQEYNNWFNQQSNLAGLGQTSAQSLGALGQNSANNVSNLLGQQGNARASGIEGQTNALTGGVADFLSWFNRRRGN